MTGHACDDAIARLYPYLDGELKGWRKLRVRWHLRKCDYCGPAATFEEKLRMVIRRHAQEDMPDEVAARLKGFLQVQEPGAFDD